MNAKKNGGRDHRGPVFTLEGPHQTERHRWRKPTNFLSPDTHKQNSFVSTRRP
jgi:hypothetical protein